MRCRVMGLTALALIGVLLPAAPAWADNWGCQVLLCLADPRGPEAEGACVPPIEKLWSALRHGDPFPTCNFSGSQNDLPASASGVIPSSLLANPGAGTGASNTWAGGGYCRQDMLYWGGPEKSELLCSATGAINVTVDGNLFTRVWWGVGGLGGSSLTEYYGSGSTSIPYDPSTAQQQFLNQQNATQSGASGGH